MRKTTEELERELEELKARKSYDSSIAGSQIAEKQHRKQVKKKIVMIKHAKKIAVIKRTGRGFGIMGKATGKFLGKKIVQAGQNYADNQRAESRPAPRRKQVRKVKKVVKRRSAPRNRIVPNMRHIFG